MFPQVKSIHDIKGKFELKYFFLLRFSKSHTNKVIYRTFYLVYVFDDIFLCPE